MASNLAAIARANYSMPPDHGAACVREVLSDDALRASWRDELDGIRAHIRRTRSLLADYPTIPICEQGMAPIDGRSGVVATQR